MNSDMTGKVCIVTGASAGIGKQTALGLARLGAAVVMLCRDRDRGEAARREIKQKSGNDTIELMICELGSQNSIRQFASEFKQRHDRLDVIINNAGVLLRERSLTQDGIETTFAINHLGYFLLTNLLLDLLKQSAPSRIVHVASAAHKYGKLNIAAWMTGADYSAFGAYANSNSQTCCSLTCSQEGSKERKSQRTVCILEQWELTCFVGCRSSCKRR